LIEEEVVYSTVSCSYFCEEAFKDINTICGQAFCTLFAAIMDINEFALSILSELAVTSSINSRFSLILRATSLSV